MSYRDLLGLILVCADGLRRCPPFIQADAPVDRGPADLGTPAEVVAALASFQVVCLTRERTVFGAGVIAQLPSLEIIVTTGMVNASRDVEAATARGIAVCGTEVPGPETAEHAFLLIVSVLNGRFLQPSNSHVAEWRNGRFTAYCADGNPAPVHCSRRQ